MKILCDRARLAAALAPIMPAIPVKEPPKHALKFLFVDARDDKLFLQASNMELSIEIQLDSVKVDEPGRALIPAKPFFALVNEVTDPTLRIEVDGSRMVLPTASGKFEMVTSDPDDYPDLSFASDSEGLEVPVQLLAQQVASTEFACAKEASRYATNGVLMTMMSGRFTTVATDGRRMALMSMTIPNATDVDEGWQILLPHKSLQATVRALTSLASGNPETTVTLFGNTNTALFVLADARISMTVIQGVFPDFADAIPRGCKNYVEFNKALLEANLRRATVLTDDANPAVRLSFEGSQAKFASEAAGLGTAETVMDVTLQGPGGHIVFNPAFILEILKASKEDLVHFEFEDENSPGKFVLSADEDMEQLYVIMPITGV
ncbi:MAG: DNA polymerase III subunit beta [Planctomycetes bacterium]|nr:DNA polymerase III subunit beta [Planctomycetota bacterium]MCB9891298.1 DNA polymerase III subunit beta [Planctomycetota bacterium]MCB9919443.1 DNA polymerase III subunit beta [Planctomycetota bacterium]